MAGMAVSGLNPLLATMLGLVDAAENQPEWWCGTIVFYGPFHEFGTEHMLTRMHWRPAIRDVVKKYGGSKRTQDALMNVMFDASSPFLAARIAIEIERKVKHYITLKHIIDTGNYRASIQTGPTQKAVLASSAQSAKPETWAE